MVFVYESTEAMVGNFRKHLNDLIFGRILELEMASWIENIAPPPVSGPVIASESLIPILRPFLRMPFCLGLDRDVCFPPDDTVTDK